MLLRFRSPKLRQRHRHCDAGGVISILCPGALIPALTPERGGKRRVFRIMPAGKERCYTDPRQPMAQKASSQRVHFTKMSRNLRRSASEAEEVRESSSFSNSRLDAA